MKCKIIKSDGSEEFIEDLYMLHITHREEEPLSIDYLTQHNTLKYEEYKSSGFKSLLFILRKIYSNLKFLSWQKRFKKTKFDRYNNWF